MPKSHNTFNHPLGRFGKPMFSLKSSVIIKEIKKITGFTERLYCYTTQIEPLIGTNVEVRIKSACKTEEEVKRQWADEKFELVSVRRISEEVPTRTNINSPCEYSYMATLSAKQGWKITDTRKSTKRYTEVYTPVFIHLPNVLTNTAVVIQIYYTSSSDYRYSGFVESKATIHDSIRAITK